MSENKLTLAKRSIAGKKLAGLRAEGQIPSVVYGEKAEPVMTQSAYNDTEKVVRAAGYHSTIDLSIDGKAQLAIIKNVAVDPVSRKIINVEFQAVSANEVIEATTPIVIVNYGASKAAVLHYEYNQAMEEIDVKAKPADLPKELTIDASNMADIDDKLTIADLVLPKGVEIADKEMSKDQVIASLYYPAAEAAAREAEATTEAVDAADVPSDNGAKPEAAAEEEK